MDTYLPSNLTSLPPPDFVPSSLVGRLSVAVCGLVVFALLFRSQSSSNVKYPPGPHGLPLIGNLRDMPTNDP